MRKIVTFTVAGTALLLSALAHADERTSSGLQPAAASDQNGMICMSYYHEGMLIRRPICKTAETWASEKARTRREVLEYQERNLMLHK